VSSVSGGPRPVGLRVAEATSGGLAALLGGAGLNFALFANTMVSVGSTVSVRAVPICVPTPCPQAPFAPVLRQSITHRSIASGGISGILEIVVIAIIAVLLVIAVGALLHGITSLLPWLVLLCLATGVLLGATVVTGFSIGLFFFPADVFALLAVGFGLAQIAAPPRSYPLPE